MQFCCASHPGQIRLYAFSRSNKWQEQVAGIGKCSVRNIMLLSRHMCRHEAQDSPAGPHHAVLIVQKQLSLQAVLLAMPRF